MTNATSRRRVLRRASLCLSTILMSGLAAPALAQNAPAFRNLDENGVDLVKGDWVMNFEEGSIGSGEAELKLIRRGPTASNWDQITFQRSFSGSAVTITIGLGTQSDTFTGTTGSTTYTSAEANGATLTQINAGSYTYQSSGGTKVTYYDPSSGVNSNFCNAASTGSSCILLPQTIKEPDQDTVTFAWSITSQGGSPVTYLYALQSVANNFGYSIVFGYDAGQRRASASLRNSNASPVQQAIVDYAYPSAGMMTIYGPAGQIWDVTANSIRVVGEATPGFSVDNPAAVSSVTRAGVTSNYSRVVNGNTITMTITRPLGSTTTIVSDVTVGRPSSVTDALNRTTSYTYDASKRLTRVTSPESNYINYTLDTRGNVTETRRRDKAGNHLNDIVSTAKYPDTCANALTCNKPEWTRDAKGNQTDYLYYNTHGGLMTATLPPASSGGVRPQTHYTYADIGPAGAQSKKIASISQCISAASCTGTAGEVKTTFAYGGAAAGYNVTSITRAAGDNALTATTAFTYDGRGDVMTVDGPLAGSVDTIRYRRNPARKLVGMVGPDPDGAGPRIHTAQSFTYGLDGLVRETHVGTVPDQTDTGWHSFQNAYYTLVEYNANKRPIRERLFELNTSNVKVQSEVNYDALGRVNCTVTRMDPAQWTSQTDACVPQTTGPNGPDRVGKTIYNAASEVTQVQTAVGTADASNEVTSTYTGNGKLATVKDGENNLTTYEYDGHDRLLKTRYPVTTLGGNASSTTDYEQLTYDHNGNVIQRRLRDGLLVNFAYDNLDRLTFKDAPATGINLDWDVTYSYDLLGRMTQALGNGWAANAWSYDALGRMTTEQNYGITTTRQYDLAGRMTRLTWPDSFYVTYDYDETGNVTAIRENGATSGIGVLATYSYDSLGRRLGINRGNGTAESYGLDALGRVAGILQDLGGGTVNDLRISPITFNPANQITSLERDNDLYAWGGHYNRNTAETPNGLNQLITQGSSALSYDARGNLTGSGSNAYTYTHDNRLASGPGLSLAYEPGGGQLLQTYTSGGVDTRWGWSGNQLVAEINGPTGQLLRRYVPGPGFDEPIVWYEGSGTTDRRWLHRDERGSIIAVSNASGNAIAINKYDEYGNPAATNLGRFGYTGQTWLPELQMWNYKARIYNPKIGGRFIQPDPIGYSAGMNLYAYVGGDPVNRTDPLGLFDDDIIVTAKRLSDDGGGGGSWSWGFYSYPTPSFNFGGGDGGGVAPQPPCPPGDTTLEDGTCEGPPITATAPTACLGQFNTYAFGLNSTLAVFFGLQSGGQIGITYPKDDIVQGSQFFFSVQGTGTLGIGAFLGLGGSVSIGEQQGTLPLADASSFGYAEANAGWGPSLGVSVQGNEDSSSLSAAIPAPRLGRGYGVYGGIGGGGALTFATPPIGC